MSPLQKISIIKTQGHFYVKMILLGSLAIGSCQVSSGKEVEALEKQVQALEEENRQLRMSYQVIEGQRKEILHEIAKKGAVVHIKAYQKWSILSSAPGVFSSSGVIIDPDGYVITCEHGLYKNGSVFVSLNAASEECKAQVIAIHATEDLALLKIDVDKKLTPLAFGDSDVLKKGDPLLQ